MSFHDELADPRRYERQIDRLHERYLFTRHLYELRQDDVSLASVVMNRRKVARVLAPAGLLVATVPARPWLWSYRDEAAGHPPAPGEWSAKEVLAHLCDFDRVFSYRALRFSRGDTTPVAGFDQEPYVAESGANERPLGDLVEEFTALRRATLLQFAAMSETMLGPTAVGIPPNVASEANVATHSRARCSKWGP